MTSFLSKLFGGGTPKDPISPAREAPVSYGDLSIISAPEKTEGGQWRLSGYIVKADENSEMERYFVRVDTFSTREEAIEFALRKGKQIIEEQGDRLFAGGETRARV